MTEKNSITSWLPYMFQINCALHFDFLSRELFVFLFCFGNIFGSGCLCLNYAWFTHSGLCRSLFSEGIVSVLLTKCQLTFMDASFQNSRKVWKVFNSCGVLVFLLICCYPLCKKRAHLH